MVINHHSSRRRPTWSLPVTYVTRDPCMWPMLCMWSSCMWVAAGVVCGLLSVGFRLCLLLKHGRPEVCATGNTVVRRSALPQGLLGILFKPERGLFALKDISEGTIIASFRERTIMNRGEMGRYLAMHGGTIPPDSAIYVYKTWLLGQQKERHYPGLCAGYWVDTGWNPHDRPGWWFMNHSDLPNCKTHLDDLGNMSFRTTRNVNEGEELCHAYGNPHPDWKNPPTKK